MFVKEGFEKIKRNISEFEKRLDFEGSNAIIDNIVNIMVSVLYVIELSAFYPQTDF